MVESARSPLTTPDDITKYDEVDDSKPKVEVEIFINMPATPVNNS